jgi:RimJ/RimL family protein N-acetyltransferase
MLEGKNVVLRPLETEDLEQLKKWRNSKELRPNFREFRPLNNLDQQEWFKSLPQEHRNGIWIHMNNTLSILKDMASCRNK